MILVSIGEIGISGEGLKIVLRPSLYAMSQLGNPVEIVELFYDVMSNNPKFSDCIRVLWCCTDKDISKLTGYLDENLKFVKGLMTDNDIVVIARSLLKHGIVGDVKQIERLNPEEKEFTKEFDARENAAIAIAHLGFSERDAWNLTMTGLISALVQKYPKSENENNVSRAPTLDEHSATMDWFEKIQMMRKA